ncbi:MAG: sensor histidine kinase, partial [Deltaproteobacteria bacterium]|nr:sensor histidine kinase [Deltaproteobacteria bacterium]
MAVSERVLTRLEKKKADYTTYGFSRVESNALKTYFDLAQEFDDIQDVYQVSVGIPKSFFGLEARLYVVDPRRGGLSLVASTEDGSHALTWECPGDVDMAQRPYCAGESLILPIRGKKQLVSQLPFRPVGDVIGVLEVYPCDASDAHRVLFFEKYANRIGFSLHMRFLLQKNVEHVEFVRRLVAD